MIALSCGVKISAVRHLVLSQSTRVIDGQTDGRTDRITTPKTALAYARAVKTVTARKLKFYKHLDGSSAPFGNDNFFRKGASPGCSAP